MLHAARGTAGGPASESSFYCRTGGVVVRLGCSVSQITQDVGSTAGGLL